MGSTRASGRIWLGILVALVLAGCGRDAATSDPEQDGSPGRGASPAKPAGNPDKPLVRIETSLGGITLELDAQKAKLTVDNFLQYVDQKHYDGTIFHQINPGYAIVGGSYTPGLDEKPVGVTVRNEAHNGLSNRRGTIAMTRRPEAIDSATCQFFLNLADNPDLDHKNTTPEGYGYCVFGKVIDGLDVLDRIGRVAVDKATTPGGVLLENVPVEPVLIQSVRRGR